MAPTAGLHSFAVLSLGHLNSLRLLCFPSSLRCSQELADKNNRSNGCFCLAFLSVRALISIKKTPHKGEFLINGSDCRARTCDQSVNSRLLYHWAKSEWWRPVPELNRYKRICSPLHKPFCQPANFELPSTHSVSLYIQFFCFTSREIFTFFAHNFIFFWKPQKINLLAAVEK